MTNITLISIVKNEEENLKKWSQWLPKLNRINELVILDDNSTDNTKKSALSLSSKNLKVIFKNRGLDGNFSHQRNEALKYATNDWVLFLDSDENPSPELITFLNQESLNPATVYAFKRHLIYIDQIIRHGQAQNDYPVRLFIKTSGKYVGQVHEIWKTTNNIKKINIPILHSSAPSLKIFLDKINFYSTLRAQELFSQKVPIHWVDIIIYPKAKFIDLFFFKLGFLDGIAGLIITLSLSFHSFLVRSKLWRLYHP